MKSFTDNTCIFNNNVKMKAHFIDKLLTHLKMNEAQFEKEAQLGASTINKAKSRGTGFGFGTITKIKKRFPEVSEDWLKTGKGEMILDSNHSEEGQDKKKGEIEKEPELNDMLLAYNKLFQKTLKSGASDELKDAMGRIQSALFDIAKHLNED